MTLFGLILLLVIFGVALELLTKYIPIDPVVKIVIRVIIVLAAVIFLLSLIGVDVGINFPRLR